jgi:DNA-binding FrmR family transcriptional regulator
MTTRPRGGRMKERDMHGYAHTKASHLRRLRRIEGQVRGLQRMIETDEYCIDVLTQISAATRALQAVSLGLLDEHLKHCVSQAITEGGTAADAKIAEASDAIARLVRS